jgi:hypothetical protein
LLNVHIYKLNLCYGKEAAKIGMIYENDIFKKIKTAKIESFFIKTGAIQGESTSF